MSALPLLLTAVGFGVLSGWWVQAGLAILAAGASMASARRIDADRLAQLALTLTAIVGALLLAPEDTARPTGPLDRIWALIASAALLVSAARFLVRTPLGGPRTTAAVTLFAVMAVGGYPGGTPWTDGTTLGYAVFAGLVCLLQLEVLARGDATWAPGQRTTSRPAILITALLIAAPFAVALPLAHAWLLGEMFPGARSRAGFSNHVALGSLHDMLQSQEPVLRVSGREVDHLRGAVYTRYAAGRWAAAITGAATDTAPGTDPGGAETRVELIGELEPAYFVPLDARAVSVPRGVVVADDNGVLRPIGGRTEDVTFDAGARDRFLPAAPGEADLDVPEELRAPLGDLALRWTGGHDGAAARVQAIAERLRTDYTYSLEFTRSRKKDPVLEFLQDGKQGHCEYFASAMTLLARAAGVPARMVGGFRVTERNPLSGTWLVRQRDAHAWTEVFLDGRWSTVDATPPGGPTSASETGLVRALFDALGHWTRVAWRWVAARTLAQLAAMIGPLLLLWLLVRLRRARRARRPTTAAGKGFDGPPPELTELLAALAKRGARHEPTEPLERFARRLTHPEAAAALLRYAELRYGRVGTAGEVNESLRAATRQVSPSGDR